ncbi:hypothetical protein BN3590_02483 [Clostridium sp. C105KSO15]|nr:hypothetical protein BN3590_02483 [Clostridium sp. C105KSO15]
MGSKSYEFLPGKSRPLVFNQQGGLFAENK